MMLKGPVRRLLVLSRCPFPALDLSRAGIVLDATILILDEVMCGFRVAVGGAQVLYKIAPVLTCLGKANGGDMSAATLGVR